MVNIDEPFQRLLCQGMVLKDGAKMSKSLGNTIDPGHIIDTYGADTARLFILFGAPVERDLEYSDTGIEGAFRFLKRFYALVSSLANYELKQGQQKAVEKVLHKTIKAVTEDLQRFSFNTAISRLMECTNAMYSMGTTKAYVSIAVQLIAPIAPFMADECWQLLGNDQSVHQSQWPRYDGSLVTDDTITVVCQVNGKVRDKLQVERDANQEQVEALVNQSEKLQGYLNAGTVRKIIYVKNKLISFVVK